MIDYAKMIHSATHDLHGYAVQVKAVPYALVRALVRAEGGDAKAEAAAAIVRACCSIDGEGVDPDQLDMVDIAELSKAAMEVSGKAASDFPTSPDASASGG